MSKGKTKKRIVSQKKPLKDLHTDRELFLFEIDSRVKRVINSSLLPIEQRLTLLFERIQNVKANVIAALTILNENGILDQKEFYKEFLKHEALELGGVDSLGRMEGNPIFSIYGVGE